MVVARLENHADRCPHNTGVPQVDSPGGYLQPVAQVVLMGDVSAVYAGTEGHRRLFGSAGVFDKVNQLLVGRELSRGLVSQAGAETASLVEGEELFGGVYIDDLGVIGVVPRGQFGSVESRAQLADQVYIRALLPRSEAKDPFQVETGRLRGPTLHGARGAVGLTLLRRMTLTLVAITAKMVLGAHSGRAWGSCLGHWAAVLGYWRCGFAMLAQCYVLGGARDATTSAPSS